MFYLNKKDAKALSRNLTRRLGSKHPDIALGQVLDAVAGANGFADWNAMSASFSEKAVDALLRDHELAHAHDSGMADIRAEDTGEGGYGPEAVVQVHNGFMLKTPAYPAECDYVRVCDPLGRETSYWSSDELRDDPACVMGAIMGALVRGQPATAPSPDEHFVPVPVIQDVPFDRLEAVLMGGRRYAVQYTEQSALDLVLRHKPLTEEEREENDDETVLTLFAQEDHELFEDVATVGFLLDLRWDADCKAFVDSDGSPYVFVLVTAFGR
jgi:hypothetical protein